MLIWPGDVVTMWAPGYLIVTVNFPPLEIVVAVATNNIKRGKQIVNILSSYRAFTTVAD